jgi:hypothetical protein
VLLGGVDKVSSRLEGKAGGVRVGEVEDVLRDPALYPHQACGWDANGPVATGRLNPTRSGSLLHAEYTVWVLFPSHHPCQHLTVYVRKVRKVCQGEHDREVSGFTLYGCGCDLGSQDCRAITS